MDIFSPKKEILNHFDELIHQVDINIEESLEKYNENQLLGEIVLKERIFKFEFEYELKMFDSCKLQEEKSIEWSKSTKVVDYLNQVRMKTIEELKNEQQKSVENSSQFNHLKVAITDQKKKEELKIQLLSNNFCFQIKIQRPDVVSLIFDFFTFVTDFYISQAEISILEILMGNFPKKEDNSKSSEISKLTFDEKMVLIGLLSKFFRENIQTQRFPNHLIRVSKQDLLKIKRIDFKNINIRAINLTNSSIDLSKLEYLNVINLNNILEEVKIEGLSSLKTLKLNIHSVERISLKNLNSLKNLEFECSSKTDYRLQNGLIDYLKTLEDKSSKFHFENSSFSIDFGIDKSLFISFQKTPNDNDNFNFEFIQYLYNDINKLVVSNSNVAHLEKLVSQQNFPSLIELEIWYSNIDILERKMLNGSFPAIQSLKIMSNEFLETIDPDAFSNLKQLRFLEIDDNPIESIDGRTFSELVNLESICLSKSRLKIIDRSKVFSNLNKLKQIETYPSKLV